MPSSALVDRSTGRDADSLHEELRTDVVRKRPMAWGTLVPWDLALLASEIFSEESC